MSSAADPGNPAPDVLADLILTAMEADRVQETYDLLEELAGPAMLRAAHGIVFDRLRYAVVCYAEGGDPGSTAGDVFDLTRRLRAETSQGAA